jgi:hypothetical protein
MGEGSEGAKPPVGDQQIALFQDMPETLEEHGFVSAAPARGRFDERACAKAEDGDHVHRGKTAARLLARALRPAGLIGRGVGHGNTGAVHQLDGAPVPECAGGDVPLHALDQVGADIVDHLKRDFRASLAVGAAVRAQSPDLLARGFAAQEGHDLANRFAAGTRGGLHLIQKGPEDHVEGKDALAAIVTRGVRGEQGVRDTGAKKLPKLGNGVALGELGKSLLES